MLSAGVLSERIGYTRMLVICMVVEAAAIAWLLIAGNVLMFYLFAIVFGFFQGAVIPVWTMVPVEFFGVKSLGTLFGIIMLMGTLGGAIGVPVSGFIFDITGSYQVAFTIGTFIGVITVVLSIMLLRYKRKA
jgi:MFS family permease